MNSLKLYFLVLYHIFTDKLCQQLTAKQPQVMIKMFLVSIGTKYARHGHDIIHKCTALLKFKRSSFLPSVRPTVVG